MPSSWMFSYSWRTAWRVSTARSRFPPWSLGIHGYRSLSTFYSAATSIPATPPSYSSCFSHYWEPCSLSSTSLTTWGKITNSLRDINYCVKLYANVLMAAGGTRANSQREGSSALVTAFRPTVRSNCKQMQSIVSTGSLSLWYSTIWCCWWYFVHMELSDWTGWLALRLEYLDWVPFPCWWYSWAPLRSSILARQMLCSHWPGWQLDQIWLQIIRSVHGSEDPWNPFVLPGSQLLACTTSTRSWFSMQSA